MVCVPFSPLTSSLLSASVREDAITRYAVEIADKAQDSSSSIDDAHLDSRIVAPISRDLAEILYDEQEDPTSPTRPRPGAVVGLVGRVAFPCVCEVSNLSATLFTDQRACVVADGVKWQSLYLVFLGRYMLLAEPVKQG
jgi:hypothetical protein